MVDRLVEHGSHGCFPVICAGENSQPTTLAWVPNGSTATEVHIEIGPSDGNEEVEWHLSCRGTEPWCTTDLAEGRSPLPTQVDVKGLELRPFTELILELWVSPVQKDVDYVVAKTRQSHVIGQVKLEALPTDAFPVLYNQSLVFDGHSGPCLPAEANCTSILIDGTSFTVAGSDGPIVAAQFTMTWQPPPAAIDQVMQLRLSPAYCYTSCPSSISVQGTSPLKLEAPDLVWRAREIWVDVIAESFVGSRTPVHIEGQLSVAAET